MKMTRITFCSTFFAYNVLDAINGTNMTLSNWYGNGNIANNAVSAVSKTAAIRIVRVVGYR